MVRGARRQQWFTRVVAAAAIIEALFSLDLHYPKASEQKLKGLAARKALLQGRGLLLQLD
jgi:hypothetical protein